jgi:hypothetical protein
MKKINDTISEKMLAILRGLVGKRLISYEVNPFAGKMNDCLYSLMLNIDDEKIELFADIDYFTFLGEEDYYSIFEIHKTGDKDFDKRRVSDKLKEILVNQKIEDIKILTDSYHCTNEDENLDEMFVLDYAIVFILENSKICFEHQGMWSEFINIICYEKDQEIKFEDISGYFDGEAEDENDKFVYHTVRNQEYKSVMDIHR